MISPQQSLEKKRCLVTGASGFIGAHLVRNLIHAGAEVTALVRENTDLWRLKMVQSVCSIIKANLVEPVELDALFAAVKPAIVFNSAFPAGYPADLPGQICSVMVIILIVGFVIDVLTTGWKAVKIANVHAN